jgi:hypothetical protein
MKTISDNVTYSSIRRSNRQQVLRHFPITTPESGFRYIHYNMHVYIRTGFFYCCVNYYNRLSCWHIWPTECRVYTILKIVSKTGDTQGIISICYRYKDCIQYNLVCVYLFIKFELFSLLL